MHKAVLVTLAALATLTDALRVNRRSALCLPCAAVAAPGVAAAKDRVEGYAVQKSPQEWQRALSAPQYFVLRSGGTEPPNSSPLVEEKRSGVFGCAACDADLFASGAKFESGTGWPSFATGLPNVEVEATPIEFLSGAELRCARCGGHLGDRFLDGALFPGTPAFASGKRYCIDGSALVFYPADGGKPVLGEFDPGAPRELPAWAQPPGIKVN